MVLMLFRQNNTTDPACLFSQTIPKHPIFVGVALMDNEQEFKQFVSNVAPGRTIKSSDDLKQLTSIQQARIQTWINKNKYHLTDSQVEEVNENDTPQSITETISNDKSQQSLGIDIQSTQAFSCLQSDKREFLRSYGCFSDTEISYCMSKLDWQETAAGIFALKEAVVKAERGTMNISDVTVNHSQGVPTVNNYTCSISHDNGFAIAVAFKNNNSHTENYIPTEKNDLAQGTVSSVKNITFMKIALLSVGISLSTLVIYDTVLKDVSPF